MTFDIFLSICQTTVDGVTPSERTMWENFFSQVARADALGFSTAWVAETHLSCQVQKRNREPVIPHFEGEIGLNTDILQLAHKVFGVTRRIEIGSAIRNILCNGGPIAHAEAVRTFLSLHGLDRGETRKLHLGFASGRFPFSNTPYGIVPRSPVERAAWGVLKGAIFREATEIFLRFLKGEVFSSAAVAPKVLVRDDFRTEADWQRVLDAHGGAVDKLEIPPYWVFEEVGVIPAEAPLELLRLVVGCHDARGQLWANRFLPCGVFNLSITPDAKIEETHKRMQAGGYHKDGGPWSRALMPRTVLVFVDRERRRAEEAARKALETYWKALEGTIDPAKIAEATDNALVGTPEEVAATMKARFHPDDRLMLWFDFNNHDGPAVERAMTLFMEEVAPRVA